MTEILSWKEYETALKESDEECPMFIEEDGIEYPCGGAYCACDRPIICQICNERLDAIDTFKHDIFMKAQKLKICY
jgi:hypothetical protein